MMACFKDDTISCFPMAIGIDSFTVKYFNSTIKTGFRISDRSDTGASIDQYGRINTI